jgi:hypothetical protein
VANFAFSLFFGGRIGTFFIDQSFERAGFNETLFGLVALTAGFVPFAAFAILYLTEPHVAEGEGLAPDRRAGGDSAGALPE